MIGKTISHYRIVEKLGEGGMGVVYKARDAHLDRFVALKVLPAEKVADPERKRRFVQEAKAASALNHPNIITIHDIANENGIDFIVMEYVQGKTLDALVPRKGLRLNETVKLAIQMADALAKAHSVGIIHRDLKPTNVMVTDDGHVKVLDFGLAKLTEVSESGNEATLTLQHETEEGTIVGTVSYMSPEQAEGKKVDARSDIFSFGSVLYEMATGQQAFHGDSKMSTLAAILNKDPKRLTELSEGIPADLEKIVTRCLRKAPERRLQTMADLKVALEDLKEESDSGKLATKAVPHRVLRRVWLAGLILLLLAVPLVVWLVRSTNRTPLETPMVAVPLTSYPGEERQPTFSPDGNQVAFSWNGEKQDNFDIYVKLINGSGRPLRLTMSPAEDFGPAWSPDGRWIAFLRKLSERRAAIVLIPPIGGLERKLAETAFDEDSLLSPFLSWAPDGNWLVVSDQDSLTQVFGLFLLSIETGEKRRLTSPAVGPNLGDSSPALSPDGRTLAFSRSVAYATRDFYMLALSNDLKPMGEPKRVTFDNREGSSPVWTADGREIIFCSGLPGGSGLSRMAVSGADKPQRLGSFGENGSQPAISRQGGRLAYAQGLEDTNIWRIDMSGVRGRNPPPVAFISSTRYDAAAHYSPDGKKIAFGSDRSGNFEIWMCDNDGSNAVQLTSLRAVSFDPMWSPDSERVVFNSNAEGQFEIYVVNINGGRPQRLTFDPANDENPSWSRDGRWIYFDSNRKGGDIWKVPAQGGEAVLVNPNGVYPVESPDGKFVYFFKDYLWKAPAGGGEASQVFDFPILDSHLAITDEGIYFVPKPQAAARSSIQFFNFATRKVKEIATIDKPVAYGLSVSPDRHWIIYSQLDQRGSDLMLVENFR
jgi:eukaryotic-like serine/threonine-protein kinase